jgi:hypothetical protein
VNLLLTKEIVDWIVEAKERVILIAFVWCIPFIGAAYTFKKLGRDNYDSSSYGTSGVSAGLMGMDEIFNPSTKYIVEAQQEEHVEVREDDEPYKGKCFEEIVITGNTRNGSTKDA